MRDEEIKKLQNEATAEKKVTFTQDYNKRRGPSHGSGNWASRRDSRPWCQPNNLLLEEISGQVIRILTTFDKIDLPSEETTRITIMIDTMTTERDHRTRQTKTNPGIGEVIKTLRDRLHCHDKSHPSRILAINPDQIRLILQYSTVLGIRTRITIYPTKKIPNF